MVGSEISHYRILEQLGSGGMGVVYKALDLRLDRTVALKFLSPFLTADPEARLRFIREAKAASALQHNNICTIHDIDQAPDGRLFIVMDCYQGETLKKRIERSSMPVDEVVHVAIQLARGLAKAHENGIVHRDIKSENVFLTADGVVKILDFGLAKLAGQSLTQGQAAGLGTVASMSPEQVADGVIDASTDIWSFGVVLYEMLTRRLPFQGQLATAIMYAILNDELPPISSLDPETPEHLSELCSRCLSKTPSGRPRSMDEVLRSLEGTPATHNRRVLQWALGIIVLCLLAAGGAYMIIATLSTSREARLSQATLAILQFRDYTRDTTAAGWPEVVQSVMVSCLTGVEGLRVYDPVGFNSLRSPPSTGFQSSAMAAVNPHLPIVEYTFEGSILRNGGRYILQLNVCNAANQEVLASIPSTIMGEGEIPRAVDSMSLAGLEIIQSSFGVSRRAPHLQPWWPKRFRSVFALKAFSRGCRLALRGGNSGSEEAFRLAIALDSTFITPRVWLVTRLAARGEFPEANLHLRTLLTQRDSASPFERTTIDWAKACVDQDVDRQIALLNSALEYSPGNAILLYSLGRSKYIRGDYRGCVDVLQPVALQNWEYPPLYLLLAQSLGMLNEFETEKATLQHVLRMEYAAPESHVLMATVYRREDNDVAAAAEDDAFIQAMTQQGVPMRTIYQMLSDANINEGFYNEGIAYYRHALGGTTETADGHLVKGDTLCARGDTLYAIVQFARALAIDSTNRHATLSLAQGIECAKQPALALHYYRRYLMLDSVSQDADFARSRIALLHP